MSRNDRRNEHDGEDPTEQLARWRSWRHDTAEFPPVGGPERENLQEDPAGGRYRGRPGLFAGLAAVLAAVVVVGALAFTGVGPFGALLGFHDSSSASSGAQDSGSTGSSTSPQPNRSGSSSGSGSSSAPSSNAPSSNAPSGGATKPAAGPSGGPAPVRGAHAKPPVKPAKAGPAKGGPAKGGPAKGGPAEGGPGDAAPSAPDGRPAGP